MLYASQTVKNSSDTAASLLCWLRTKITNDLVVLMKEYKTQVFVVAK